ncbi:MAG TPA: hypothetical protein ENN85_00470 [Methanoculleus sp.]|nr:hypothetical protein [Methanoculleus sp.]
MTEEETIYEEAVCCHCEGLGCRYCDGKGKVLVARPAKKCRHCHGECCIYCGYTGWEGVKGKYE